MRTSDSTTRPVREVPSIGAWLIVMLPFLFIANCGERPRNEILMEPDSGRVLYEGMLLDGLYHGTGLLYRENGKLEYRGDFRNGQFHGQGNYYALDGHLAYSGEFENGAPHGHGRTFYPNGQVHYEGEWEMGERSGEGVLCYKDGTLAYEGEWQEDRRHGYGKFYIYGKLVYEGRFSRGKMLDESGHVVNQKAE